MTTPVQKLTDALYKRNCNPKQNARGWTARCPAHDDRKPSLSYSSGNDGRVLVTCHAGCDTEAVCAVLGLTTADLFDRANPSTSTKPQEGAGNGGFRRRRQSRGAGSTIHETAGEAIEALESQHGSTSNRYPYHDANGEPVGMILRWDTPTGKDIRPVSRNGKGWAIEGMPTPRPLYRLPDLAGAEQVYVVEGEKAAEAGRELGLAATTSPHGSSSADTADWTPLAGKEVVVLPDHDEAGERYADNVMACLAKLKPAPVVKIVRLNEQWPELPAGGDLADVLDLAGDDRGGIRLALERLVDDAKRSEFNTTTAPVPVFEPFPTNALPEPIRSFVTRASKAIGCDPSFVSLPLLAALASAIGNTRRIQLKRGWAEPAILWATIVGDSGTMKSPALEQALKPVRERQRKATREHVEAVKRYNEDKLVYERDLSNWKRAKEGGKPPKEPEPPILDRCWCDDTTVEAIAVLLLNQPRGLLMVRDELAGWAGAFDCYKQAKGGDVAKWLEMHGGRPLLVDRKTADLKMIYVPRAAVSITGGIQPEALRRMLGPEYRENGLASRILMAMPPRKRKRWTETDIPESYVAAVTAVMDQLFILQPEKDADGEPYPKPIKLSPEAKSVWIEFYNALAAEQAGLAGDLAAAWSKLEGYAARLALVIHCTRYAAGDSTLTNPDQIDEASITSGITLSRWFGIEARRIYAMISEDKAGRERRELMDWIAQKYGGTVTVRELQQGCRRFKASDEAETALNDLVAAGYGRMKMIPPKAGGGRPSHAFVLSSPSTVYRTPTNPEKSGGSVDVDTVAIVDEGEI